MSEEETADLLAFALTLRPDRLQGVAVSTQPEAVRAGSALMTSAIASLALAEPAAVPSGGLRARLMSSLTTTSRRAALVVVDMIHDHLAPGSVLEVSRAREIVPHLQVQLAAARAANTPVIYVVDRHDPSDSDLDDWGVHAVVGTKGAEIWHEVAPAAGDRVVEKPSYSAFFASKLEAVLDELRIDTLVLTGCSTEVQLFATATDALQKGFEVEVPLRLQAGITEQAEQSALAVLGMLKPYKPAREARLERLRLSPG